MTSAPQQAARATLPFAALTERSARFEPRPRRTSLISVRLTLRRRLRLFLLLQQIQILLRGDGLCAGLFRLLPRFFRLLPIDLTHLFHLSVALLLLTLQ